MKLILKSLISNTASLDGARKRKWWVSLILLFLSLIIAIIPTFVTAITTKGSATISNNTFGIDDAFKSFTDDAKQKDYSLVINDDGKMVIKNEENWVEKTFSFTHEGFSEVNAIIGYKESCSAEEFKTMCEANNCSLVVFTKNDFMFSLVNPNNTESSGSGLVCYNAWKDFDNGYDVVEDLGGANSSEVRSHLISFVDKAYNYERVTEAWIQTGIFSAINFAVVLLMGLMVWILTRGKNNPYRMYTFWEALKISFWCCLSPAILTVPLGFLIKGLMNTLFPMLFGIRVMWLTMKSLRPDGSGYQDTKEVKTVDVKPTKK